MPDQTARDAADYTALEIATAAIFTSSRRADHALALAVLAALGIPPDTPVQDVREALALLDTRYAMEERLSQFQNAAAALIREIDHVGGTTRVRADAARTHLRRVTAIVALLAASSCVAFASSAHAAPRPDTLHPLDYNQRTIARALPEWGINALEQADASGWYWTPTRSVCVRTRPAHYRCDATGSWSTVGEPGVRVTYRLRNCTASRRIGTHALYRDGATWRARVRVDYRGGIACRVPSPPYIPAS